MRLKYNQFLALVYGDIFDWPLTKKELTVWRVASKEKKTCRSEEKAGYCFLPGRERLVKERLVRENFSAKKKVIAEITAGLLFRIPSVEAIFLTGSVAVGSAKRGGDIDLMIITSPGMLWLTRLAVVAVLKALGNYGNGKDRICPNIFLDTNHLEIKERNLYTAHEVLQTRCLFDRGGTEKKWLTRNKWTRNFLPNAYKLKIRNCRIENSLKIVNWKLKILGLLELPAFVGQYFYQLPKQTNEKLGWGYAFFHPDRRGDKVEDKFRQRLVKYNG